MRRLVSSVCTRRGSRVVGGTLPHTAQRRLIQTLGSETTANKRTTRKAAVSTHEPTKTTAAEAHTEPKAKKKARGASDAVGPHAAPTRFEGFIAATLTPMDRNAKPTLGRIKDYAQRLIKDGCSGVFVCGTSGESMSLSLDERKAAVEQWIKHKGSLKVIAQIGTTSLEQTKELAAHAESVGADGISVMSPFFFKPADAGVLVDYCASVAKAAPKTPFLYYHYPAITGVNIPVYDFIKQAHGVIPTLRGAKYTGTELGDYYRALRFQDSTYDILMGFEYMHLACLALGSKGGISLSFSFCAPLYKKMFDAFHKNDLETARQLQLAIADFIAALNVYGYVPSGKAIMKEWYGIEMGPSRLPLRPLSEAEQKVFFELDAVKHVRSILGNSA